jgi:Uma2 family endonuclease
MRGSVTRAAEGFDRRAFTVDEVLRMQEAGIKYDRGLKSRLYARHKVKEFWVVDAAQRRTFVHNGPKGEGWRNLIDRGPEETLTCSALPAFALRLDEV